MIRVRPLVARPPSSLRHCDVVCGSNNPIRDVGAEELVKFALSTHRREMAMEKQEAKKSEERERERKRTGRDEEI